MESTLLGLVLDSSIIIEAERKGQTVEQLLEHVKESAGEVEILICSVTVAELVHGIYRANTLEIRDRRRAFIDELKRNVPVHPVTEATAEIIGRISGEQERRRASRFHSTTWPSALRLWNKATLWPRSTSGTFR
jgi:predicted nucleic acid-binding protein